MPQDQQPPQPDIEPGIEALIQQGADTNQLLETLVTQGEKNNPEPALEAMIKSIQDLGGSMGSGTEVADGQEIRVKGVKGDKGDDGLQGIPGAQGPQGPQGIQGPIGQQGEQGARGERGFNGSAGSSGSIGEAGPEGPPGPKGDKGDAGSPDTGEDIVRKHRELPVEHRISYDELRDRPNFETLARGRSGFGDQLAIRVNGTLLQSGVKVVDFVGSGWTITDLGGGVASVQKVAGSTNTVYTETPSGAIDGSNKTYTTAHSITTIYSFAINGIFIHPGDYSVIGSTITFGTALDISLAGLPFTIIYA